MPEMSSGAALRQLDQAQARLKKARQSLRLARDDPQAAPHALELGWESLRQALRAAAEIPLSATSEPVLTRQLAVQRAATALLVRLRRLMRRESTGSDSAEDDDLEDEDF
jgi:hypothetical protein